MVIHQCTLLKSNPMDQSFGQKAQKDLPKAKAVAVDNTGSVYVAGIFGPNATFEGTVLSSSGGKDIFVAKYESNGSLAWVKKAGGTGMESVRGLALDNENNTVVFGNFSQTANFGNIALTSGGGTGGYLWKIDTNGSQIWAKNAGTGTGQIANQGDIDIDKYGNIYLGSTFTGTASFGDTTLSSNGTNGDIFVAKFDVDGNATWAEAMLEPPMDLGKMAVIGVPALPLMMLEIALSLACLVVLLHLVRNVIQTPNPTCSDSSTYIAKYNEDGLCLWAKRQKGRGQGRDIITDPSGNFYLSGQIRKWI